MNIKTLKLQTNARPRLILNPLMLLVFAAAWIRDAIYWFPTDAFGTTLNYWAFTDWLIDYSQGFIRRGLSGEFWRLMPPSAPPLLFVSILSWVLVLAAVAGYLRLLVRNWKAFHPLTFFALLFLPSLFFFYIHDHNGIARKEILGFITVLIHLLVVEKVIPVGDGAGEEAGKLRRYLLWMIPVLVLLLPAMILIHEGNFLVFIPLHAMITLSVLRLGGRSLSRAALLAGLVYLPSALAFGAVYLSGTPEHTALLALCEKWLAAGALRENSCVLPPNPLGGSTLPASLIPMEWSLAEAARITRMIIAMNWSRWLIILPVLGVSLWYTLRQAVYSILRANTPQSFSPLAARRYTGSFFIKYFLVPLLFSLPVYFTAYDYGRWFTVVCVNAAMLAVSLNLPLRELLQREGKADETPAEGASPAHLDHRLVFWGLSAVVCILALVLLLPHYCLFSCEIFRSPLEFFSHAFNPR